MKLIVNFLKGLKIKGKIKIVRRKRIIGLDVKRRRRRIRWDVE